MNITETIKKLEAFRSEHGECEVIHATQHSNDHGNWEMHSDFFMNFITEIPRDQKKGRFLELSKWKPCNGN